MFPYSIRQASFACFLTTFRNWSVGSTKRENFFVSSKGSANVNLMSQVSGLKCLTVIRFLAVDRTSRRHHRRQYDNAEHAFQQKPLNRSTELDLRCFGIAFANPVAYSHAICGAVGNGNMASDSIQKQCPEYGESDGAPVELFGPLEAFGGGSDYFPRWQLPLWPFNSIRMSVREDE